MRKNIVLAVLTLTLSFMIGIQLVIAHMDTNVIKAKVKIWPRVLFLSKYCCNYYDDSDNCFSECTCKWECKCAQGKWIIAFIKLPKGNKAKDIDPSSVTLQVLGGSVPVSKYCTFWKRIFIAKFDRASVIELLCPLMEHMAPNVRQRVTLMVTGNLCDGTIFQGQDTIKVFFVNH